MKNRCDSFVTFFRKIYIHVHVFQNLILIIFILNIFKSYLWQLLKVHLIFQENFILKNWIGNFHAQEFLDALENYQFFGF